MTDTNTSIFTLNRYKINILGKTLTDTSIYVFGYTCHQKQQIPRKLNRWLRERNKPELSEKAGAWILQLRGREQWVSGYRHRRREREVSRGLGLRPNDLTAIENRRRSRYLLNLTELKIFSPSLD